MFSAPEGRGLVLLALVPLALFAPLSLVRSIGLHWVLSFVPFALMLLVLCADEIQLKKTVRFFIGFAIVHVVVFVALAYTPIERWKNSSFYPSLVLTVKPQALLDKLEPYRDHAWMMDGYSNAVTLGVNTYVRDPDGRPRYIGVFGVGSSHARHDDILTDMRALNEGKIAILRKTPPNLDADYRPYFRQVELKTLEIEGATFYLILGEGFNYPQYRDVILTRIKQQYYAIPPALPQTACYFFDRYFPE